MSKSSKGKEPAGSSKNVKNNGEEKVKKLTQREHVLLRPGMYIGDTKPSIKTEYIYNEDKKKMIKKELNYSDGLLKIFDEILSNASDQYTRLKQRGTKNPVTGIWVEVNQKNGQISIKNNGESIEIRKHKTENIYIPELLFANFMTSENYDDNEDRRVVGTMGYGQKLSCAFSKKFQVEIVNDGKYYKQIYEKNLSIINPPEIVEVDKSSPSYVKITFTPDYKRFDFDGLTDDQFDIIKNRVYQASATTGKDLKIHFNKKQVPFKNFQEYCKMFLDSDDQFFTYESPNEDWQYGVSFSKEGFLPISFVNRSFTKLGGTHVDYILNQFMDDLISNIQKKLKSQSKGSEKLIKKTFIKDNIMIFVNASVSNPSFKSQSKEELTTKPVDFKSSAKITDKFKKAIYNSPIAEASIQRVLGVGQKELQKTDGKKKTKLVGIPNLDDANYAGSKESAKCALILTEGLSAKTMAVSGVGSLPNGRDYYGIFPLKGKVLNVKGITSQKIGSNDEITYLKKILGLQSSKNYDNTNDLRYGRLVILADQDYDGSHIKGLIMNLFQHLWPSLFRLEGFLTTFLTPVVKVYITKGGASSSKQQQNTTEDNKNVIMFYSLNDFQNWQQKNKSVKVKRVKYLKGLGTSTSNEAKEYFHPDNRRETVYKYTADSDQSIELAFNKKCTEERKTWLMKYDRNDVLDYSDMNPTYEEFINKELIHFSNYDNERSIPSMLDGLKPSQRKILYSCFKRNLTHDKDEIKVAQLAGYVSEHSAYHHGEMSLNGAIVAMAQNFVGANNINLLEPVGQFGSRLKQGDSASPRYIFTKLTKLASKIYDKRDFQLLEYNVDDDGKQIEPLFYVPVIPMVLFIKTQGIGTGFSTNIPQYDPTEIIEILIEKLKNEGKSQSKRVQPWFLGFQGKVVKKKGNSQTEESESYTTKGNYVKTDLNKVTVTELPIGNWTQDYKDYLQDYMVKFPKVLKDVTDKGNEKIVKLTLTFQDQKTLDGMMEKIDDFEKSFKLIGTGSQQQFNNTNMYLYDEFGKINKYKSINDIINKFYDIRLTFYGKRREYLLKQYERELQILSDKVRFILEIIKKTLIVGNRKKAEIEKELETKKYVRIDNSYDHLLGMPIYTLTKEKVDELLKQKDEKQTQYDNLKKKSPEQLWIDDLTDLLDCYNDYYEKHIEDLYGKISDKKGKSKSKNN